MNQLHEAYFILRLKPGASWKDVQKAWRRIAGKFHPDNSRTPEQKQEDEEDLKNINNAKDILEAHFLKGGHSASGYCPCKPDTAGAGTKQSTGGSGTKKTDPNDEQQRKRKEEAEAKRRDEERRKSWAEQEQRTQEEYKKRTEEEATKKQSETKNKNWQANIGKGAVVIIAFLVLRSCIGGANNGSNNTEENDQGNKPAEQPSVTTETGGTTPPPLPNGPSQADLLARRTVLLNDINEYKRQQQLRKLLEDNVNQAGLQIGQLARIVDIGAREEDEDLAWQRATVNNPDVYNMRNDYLSDIKAYNDRLAQLNTQNSESTNKNLKDSIELQQVENRLQGLGWTPPSVPPGNTDLPTSDKPASVPPVSQEFIMAQTQRKRDFKTLNDLQGNMGYLRNRLMYAEDQRVRNQYDADIKNYNQIADQYHIQELQSNAPDPVGSGQGNQNRYDPNGF